LNVVVAVGTEGSNEESGVVVESVVLGDGEEKVMLDVLILGAPDFLATFVNDGVLVRMVSDGGGARQGSEEVWEEFGFQGDGEREVGEDGSRQGRGGNNGNGGFNDGWQEVFNGDVSKQDMLDYFLKLEVDIDVLVFGGWGVLKLRACNISLLGGNIGEDVEEVGQGGDDGGQGQGAIGVKVWGGAITTWAGVVPGVVETIEVVLDDLVGGSDVDLISVVDL
jgi:hypothetical protein